MVVGYEGRSLLTPVFLKMTFVPQNFQHGTRSSARLGPSQLAARMFAGLGRGAHKVLTFGSSAARAAI